MPDKEIRNPFRASLLYECRTMKILHFERKLLQTVPLGKYVASGSELGYSPATGIRYLWDAVVRSTTMTGTYIKYWRSIPVSPDCCRAWVEQEYTWVSGTSAFSMLRPK
jgi:hypothetical protein